MVSPITTKEIIVSVYSPDRIGSCIEGHGRPVVLLHSSMSSRNQWRELMKTLTPGYRLIAIDLLGYGDSPLRRKTSGYELDDELRHVESILEDVLEPDEAFHLVGHSYGGVVALELARRTRRLLSLTLFEPIAIHLLNPDHCARAEFDDVAAAMQRQFEAGQATQAAQTFVDYWSGEGAFAAMPEPKQSHLGRLVPKVLLEFAALQRRTLRAADLHAITVPVCLISGRDSPLPARLLTARLPYLFAHASSVEVAAGHMAPISHPELVNPVIGQFIAAAELPVPMGHERRRSDRMTLRRRSDLQPAPARSVALRAMVFGLLATLAAIAPAEQISRAGVGPLTPAAPAIVINGVAFDTVPAFPRDGRFELVSGDTVSHQPYVLVLQPTWPEG